jgi:hypothetical protein
MTIEAMKLALEALEEINKLSTGENAICLPAEIDGAMDALRAAIEDAEKPWVKTYAGGKPNYTVPEEQQEPIGHADLDINNIYIFSALEDRRIPVGRTPLYTAPRQWQGLTDAERGITAAETWGSVLIAPQSYQVFARAIEAKLKEKNT